MPHSTTDALPPTQRRQEIAALKRMTVPELRRKYAHVFGDDTTSRHKEDLIRRIVWRLQMNQDGGLSERARQWARDLASGSDVRLTAPRPRPVASDGETTAGITFIQSIYNVAIGAAKIYDWSDENISFGRTPRRSKDHEPAGLHPEIHSGSYRGSPDRYSGRPDPRPPPEREDDPGPPRGPGEGIRLLQLR
ncbi:MAG: DUF2924 domain-containing protein [Candidatus Krumholzibacteriia bacterium]